MCFCLNLIRMSWLFKLSLQSTELWLAKKRHENVCIQRIKNCNLITNFKKAEKKQVNFVMHRILKWRTRRKNLVPSHESEALQDKQKLQMKTLSQLAECLARIPPKTRGTK